MRCGYIKLPRATWLMIPLYLMASTIHSDIDTQICDSTLSRCMLLFHNSTKRQFLLADSRRPVVVPLKILSAMELAHQIVTWRTVEERREHLCAKISRPLMRLHIASLSRPSHKLGRRPSPTNNLEFC